MEILIGLRLYTYLYLTRVNYIYSSQQSVKKIFCSMFLWVIGSRELWDFFIAIFFIIIDEKCRQKRLSNEFIFENKVTAMTLVPFRCVA